MTNTSAIIKLPNPHPYSLCNGEKELGIFLGSSVDSRIARLRGIKISLCCRDTKMLPLVFG